MKEIKTHSHKWIKIADIQYCVGCCNYREIEKNVIYYIDNLCPDDVSYYDPFPERIRK